MSSVLSQILASFREKALSERDKGTDFEHLSLVYLRNEPYYRDLYREVMTYGDWAEQNGLTKKDTGIDLVGVTHQDEVHAIQCKNYAADYRITKADIDSFFTASGKTTFSNRIIITTANNWTQNASDALEGQHPPVSTITLADLENSLIDWGQFQVQKAPILRPKKTLREHQLNAQKATKAGLATADRGKLIMACGTGKTFTSLKIAEDMAGKGKQVLFLVPSLALLSQTLTEWTQESETPLHSYAVCSDSDVGKTRNAGDDRIQATVSDLQYPATTNAKSLALALVARHCDTHMNVVFATYHSIAVISEAQKHFGFPAFDLVICDEAHRTTGAVFDGDDESAFVRVHDNDYIQAHKRLYMTATPRIYGEAAKQTEGVVLFSMDNEKFFGRELFVINFSEAVFRGLLVDYKVIVLAVEESHINRRLQTILKGEGNELKVDDAAKIIGCWKALAKQGMTLSGDESPMQRAVAFCHVIEKDYKGKNHKVSSKLISDMFGEVVAEYQRMEVAQLLEDNPDAEIDPALLLNCEARHVDGAMNASEKGERLEWLKAEAPENTCRILSNVRCLSEGVDVPSLDAVLFLTPRSSQVDVVQSVGRVMRLSPGKKKGYVILPVVIPAGVEPENALDDNKTYRVVWQVLNALRSHDDRFDAMINKLEFNGRDVNKMEVISVSDKVQQRSKSSKSKAAKKARGGSAIGSSADTPVPDQASLQFEVGEIERALYAQVVKKCGNRHHWEDWANDIAKIANTHIDRIQAILENKDNIAEIAAFEAFAKEIRDDLNNAISDADIIEMLAQHLITKPVFDALFEGYNFTQHNPMSIAMQAVTEQLEAHNIDKEADTLHSFYESVKMRAAGIESAEGKQRIIVELYDKFFKNAFPRMTERLGIVYTPIEVVDFIIHSIEDVLKAEFGKSMADENVHIIDPFTGTGTFVTRLLQSGLIPKDRLPHKYKHEIHANELVLLAYYIAAINIEATYHGIMNDNVTGLEESDQTCEVPYERFSGVCLTDTFQMYESEDMVDALLVENSLRRKRQKELDIRVIMGNPPYSIGQASTNDNNANVSYPKLDRKIEETYAAQSKAVLSKGLYDSYIRAIRWASERIEDAGIIGFVTNGGFLEKTAMDGVRKCLVDEFSSIHIFNLRGDIRKNMLSKGRAKEGGNVFGSGSMAGIAISILVKNSDATSNGQVYYHDVGSDLSREEKLEMITGYASLKGIPVWQQIVPDLHGDWLSQRDESFGKHILLGDKKGDGPKLFDNFSLGVATNRDAWAYNASKASLAENMSSMISFYNAELLRFNSEHSGLDTKARQAQVDDFINTDPTSISWTRALKQDLARNRTFAYEEPSVTASLYRPFTKQWMYFNRTFNEMVLQMPRIFPQSGRGNLIIQLAGVGARAGFSALISDSITSLDTIEKGQCFPLYLYDEQAQAQDNGNSDLFEPEGQPETGLKRRDAITDEGLAYFQEAYPGEQITKEDLFYYVYGILHSEDYRTRFADNLSKELPRIPKVKKAVDFWAFSKAGRELSKLHINYETVEKYPLNIQAKGNLLDEDYRVIKMKFGKKRCEETGKNINDRSIVIYNGKITLTGIPDEAWDYVVNGKAALDWVMERQAVTIHKASGIVNDANDWAIETMGNPKYSLELLQRVVTVSLETNKIVNSLPKLDLV